MLTIRLQRIGKKKQAYFRLVVTEHTKKPQGKFLELLGSLDPHQSKNILKVERIKYWLEKGVKVSDTAHNLLVKNGVIKAAKIAVHKKSKKKQELEKQAVVEQKAEEVKPEEKQE